MSPSVSPTETKTPNWNEIRKLFPAAEQNVFLFSAGSGPMSKPAYEAFQKYGEEFYQAGDLNWFNRVERVEACRQKVAEMLGAPSSQDIAFANSASHGMNILAMLHKERCEKEKLPLRILIPEDEFPTTSIPWKHHGFEVLR